MKLNLNRFFIFVFSFFLPPILIGFVIALSAAKSVMIHGEPSAIEGTSKFPSPKTPTKGKLNAVVVMTNSGVQISDLLIPYEILEASGLFTVFTAAPKRTLSATTGKVSIVPDFTFSDLAGKDAPLPDLVVVPAVTDHTDPELVKWLRENADQARMILSIGEGARVLARAGLLAKRTVVTHFVALKDVKEQHRNTRWVQGKRYLIDGRVISSMGIASASDATLFAIESLSGKDAAKQTAHLLGVEWNQEKDPSTVETYLKEYKTDQPTLGVGDLIRLLLHGGFDWNRTGLGVLLYNGMSEMALGATLDTYPRTLSARTVTLGEKRTFLKTLHGLVTVPETTLEQATGIDFLLVPGGWTGPQDNPLQKKQIHDWIVQHDIPVKSFSHVPPGKAYSENLDFLAKLEGSPIAKFVAKMISLVWIDREGEGRSLPPFQLLLRPFLLGLFGLFLAFLVDRKIQKRSHSPDI